MRTHSLITPIALIAAALLAGVPAAQAGAVPLRIATPHTPAALVHDLRGVLKQAGFQSEGTDGAMAAPVKYIQSISKLSFYRRQDCELEATLGYDPLRDYLSTAIARWSAEHVAGSGTWVWRSAAQLVRLTYFGGHACTGASISGNPTVQLVVVRYSLPR